MDLPELAHSLKPSETVLLLGAGAGVQSGGFTGSGLARHLCSEMSHGDIESADLAEATALLEEQYSRPALIRALRAALEPLQPDGTLTGLFALDWARLYSTNFDELVERAFEILGKPLEVIRTNRDFPRLDQGDTELLKIHGCITRDRALGHADSIVLTEQDYDTFSAQREALFAKLAFDLHTKDLLIVGQSLRDHHLKALVEQVASTAKAQSTANRVRVLAYEADAARMRLLEDRGVRVAAGTLGQLLSLIEESSSATSTPSTSAATLPRRLLHRTRVIRDARKARPDAPRLFQGGTASYADIDHDLTFERDAESTILEGIRQGGSFAAVVGAAGVGKSTLCRRVAARFADTGYDSYEHVSEFVFDWKAWLEVARGLNDSGGRAVLFVDEVSKHLSGINRLASHLEDESLGSLVLLVAAQKRFWDLRSRAAAFNRKGVTHYISKLSQNEVARLVDLCRTNFSIGDLVDSTFMSYSRSRQIELISRNCNADMFVALKFCFPGEALDAIVLGEFAELDEVEQGVYKIVAMLEASHASPSRQLVLEVLGFDWQEIPKILANSQGIIYERLVGRRDGIYVWSSRHSVIAATIAYYKFADQEELVYLLRRCIQQLNTAMLLDRDMVLALCDHEYAIGRVRDLDQRIELLELLVARGGNRVPWHRLIAAQREKGDTNAVSSAIRRAEKAVGWDSPIWRYRILNLLERARELARLGAGDELALLFEAEDLAKEGVRKWSENKYSYKTVVDVAEAQWRMTSQGRLAHEADELLATAFERILDRDLLTWKAELKAW